MRTRTKKTTIQETTNLTRGIVIGLIIIFILVIHTYYLMPHVHAPGSYNETPATTILLTSK